MPIKLNDDRQGEGGTLAVIDGDITTIPKSVQGELIKN